MKVNGHFRRAGLFALFLLLAAIAAPCPAWAQIDLSGQWRPLIHEDLGHRIDERAVGGPGTGDGAGGPRSGDYTGVPLNDAARLKADSWDPRISASREHQTILHPGGYWIYSPGALRISPIIDNATEAIVALEIYRAGVPGSTTRTIWMDGREHPPAYAAHTWQGFSTGRWNGGTLTVETTHLKAGFLRRNGVPASDEATLTEYVTRHGGYLTITRFVHDPIYLDEPYVATLSWADDPGARIVAPSPGQIVDEIPGQSRAFVPHYLPGANEWLKEFAVRAQLPFEATRGGRETVYPEYQRTLKTLMRQPGPQQSVGPRADERAGN